MCSHGSHGGSLLFRLWQFSFPFAAVPICSLSRYTSLSFRRVAVDWFFGSAKGLATLSVGHSQIVVGSRHVRDARVRVFGSAQATRKIARGHVLLPESFEEPVSV